uniref:Uncharacterized protein n=1 Tax=Avena sativa TaxID=4498 RepID=A0ACD6AAT6_AVESA
MLAKPHCEDAFSEYLRWFLENTRVKLLPDAYLENILEEPLPGFDDLSNLEYNQFVREGRKTSFAPMINFVRTEVQKQADELEGALEFPRHEEVHNKLRDFVKRQAQKLHRFTNLLGCRDPEVATSSKQRAKSTSEEEGSPEEEQSTTAEDEDEVVSDDMPLERYRVQVRNQTKPKVRSAIKLRPRNPPIIESGDDEEPC